MERALSGRRNELGVIAAALARARDGQPATIALIGEPGIGKTRLATEAAAASTASGFTVCWGRAWEAGGAPAYWPWRQLCEDLPRDTIAQLWGARGAAAADPEQARFELFAAVTQAIATRAQAGPVLCICDDLHAADGPSLELLAFATRHLRSSRVVWLMTWRDVEGARAPVRDQLARIAREAIVTPLSALSELDANQLIDQVLAQADIQLRARLVHATGGNPLFLLETLAALATGHALPSDQLPLAQGIATIVRDRLSPLSPEARSLAESASVIGREVGLARWIEAAGVAADTVRRCARELVDAGILTPVAQDRWRFGHDLVREAIYRQGDHRGIHRRLALALDGEIAAGDASLAGERAHHGLRSLGPEDDLRQVLAWAVSASEHARRQCAVEEAMAIVDRALQIGPAAHRDPALHLARGRAALDSLDGAAATEAFSTALSLARSANDPRLLAAAVLGLGARYVLGDHLHDLIALIDETMALLPPTDRELHARLLARKAAALTPAPDCEPVLEMAREALALVAESDDVAARLEVAVAAGAAFAGIGAARECAAIDEAVVTLARRQGDRALELRGLSRLVLDYVHAGDFARADATLVARDALARSLVQPRFAWMEPLFRSMRAAIRGDFAQCDAEIAVALSFAEHDPSCARACAVHRAWMLLSADRIDELRAHEPVVLAALRTMTPIISTVIRAVIRLRAGELADARRELDALEPALAHGRAPILLATIAEVAAEVGPPELQRDLYELLAPHADSYAIFSLFGIVCGNPVAATLGNLAGAMGEHERARAHFESALVMTTMSGAIVARAWTSYWYGRTLARAGSADATQHLDDAIRDATSVGMARLVARCRDAAGPKPTTPATVPSVPQPALAWRLVERSGSWLVEVGSRSFVLPNLRGMPLLERLAATPHVEIHSLELVSGSDADAGDAGEQLDSTARSAYRKRLATLADDLEEAQRRGDVARAEAICDEHEALLKELSRAVGLGGKVRRASAATERARVTAQRRLREAIRKIAELDAELGSHLDAAIRTGTFCAYRP
jgi:tetratricopeptide (TPR) repeat protein